MALNKLTKVQTLGIGSNIEVVGVITTGQFKSGTSNLHSSGVDLTNLNVSGIATIGGNVSIGGTLTYQDVTNIDSVGVITARSNIDCNGSLDVDGHTELDNVNISGVSTYAGQARFNGEIVAGSVISVNTGGSINIPDKLVHSGDPDTALRFPANDTISFETAGSERARFTKDGNLFVGSNVSQFYPYNSFTNDALFMVNGNLPTINGAGQATILTKAAYDASDRRALLSFGGNYSSAAQGSQTFLAGIGGEKENTTNGNFAGALMLYTRPHGGNETERLRISSGGAVQVNGGAVHLDANGELAVFETDTNLAFTNSAKLSFDFSGNVARIRTSINGSASIRPLAFYTGNDERLRITSDGKMGFGTNSPDTKVHIYEQSGSGSCYLKIQNNRSRNAAVQFTTSQGSWYVGQGIGADVDRFMVYDSAEKFSIDANGHAKIHAGNLEFANGNGIDFSAVPDGSRSISTDGNKFDDYEEGSFTPFIRTANNTTEPTYNHRVGLYTKVGRLVTYAIRITTSGELSTGSGGTQIHGLPFNAMNWNIGDWPGGAEIAYYYNLRGNYGTNPRLLGPYNNNTYIRFHIHNAQTDTGNNLYNHIFTNNTVMIIYGQYFAA